MAVFNGKMSKQPRDAQLLGSPSYFIDLRDLIFEPTYVWWGGVTKQRHQLVTVLVMKDVLLNCVGTPSLLYLHGLWLKSEHHKNIAKICKKNRLESFSPRLLSPLVWFTVRLGQLIPYRMAPQDPPSYVCGFITPSKYSYKL